MNKMMSCDQCGRFREVRKVKYADDSGCGSMMVCEPCEADDSDTSDYMMMVRMYGGQVTT